MEIKRLTIEECREGVFDIRRKVFIEEQNCPEHMEWEEEEERDSVYFVAFSGDRAVGCLRLRPVEQDLLKMERVAVLKEFRRRRIATDLVREAMIYVQTETPSSSIYAYAQVTALQAYVSLGFTVLSKVWIEDETFIPHQTIFWGTPVSIAVFLKHQAEKSDVVYEEYDARHPSILPKIEAYKQRLENLETWNICSLHIHLEDRVVSKIIRNNFINFCANSQQFLDGNHDLSSDIVKQSINLLKIADAKLNTGHFNEVDENWRKLYVLVSFVQSFLLFRGKRADFENAIKIADKGLCMGRIDEEIVPIRQLAWLIHEQLPGVSAPIHPSFSSFSAEKTRNFLSPLPNSVPISECDDSDDDCLERVISAISQGTPLLIRQHCMHMPAVRKWNIEFLLKELHSRTFPVEIGTKYSDEDWSQKLMTFGEFVENSESQRLYLAQHRLFDQVPHLKRDVIIPDECFGESTNPDDVDMNMWIGPSNTVSPLHTDPRNNMFVQVNGTKLFRMVSPEDTSSVYPFDGILGNTSQVDVENPDATEFPEFSRIRRMFDGVVNAGDALFIPQKWWHYVRSTTPSISISFWFD
ncbi:hypothetical protein GCK72_016633 [Caenorhabditis remanei]|uniref:N-acetyltransferase domain-containing protein n=1 Tax=Caenorhabditis remanei TaxID=31234 RepID=A0A6A5G560_CAERE|nr:hypothetical protein GCK72_016633 [Caenorhabditis remanei]KAF1750087.1 hypothetical protein GCK72_016633 [Caenorhabditis remanei]